MVAKTSTIQKKSFDFLFFAIAIALWIIGTALVYSAVAMHTTGPLASIFQNQIIWTTIGIVIVLIMVSIPVDWYYRFAPVVYIGTILLLIVALTGATEVKGAGRWINTPIPGFRFQPSEFAKIGLLLMLARYFTKKEISLQKPLSLIVPALIILVPFALVVRQPDLSTTLALVAMSLPIFYWAGMKLVEILFLISPAISAVLAIMPMVVAFVMRGTMDLNAATAGATEQTGQFGILGTIPWAIFFVAICFSLYFTRPPKIIAILVVALNLFSASAATLIWENALGDFQKARVISFINPQLDPRGSGYQVIQSLIAIGSGRMSGKGFLQGTQVNLAYLPEQHTDFIFAVLGEQFGFYGCVAVILLFFLFVARALYAVTNIDDRFVNLLVVGAASLFVYHIFVNIAMVIGLMPVTGLPLPFLSYGGSFTLTVSMLVGIILSARAEREGA
ncbi:MAG: rod shape-determining protein RodA [Chitinivibrionia bacterium]|nr:rod shape-determining protein RodA [Chitinivibrionia bacterium]